MTGNDPADDLTSANGRVLSRRSALLLGAAAALTACSAPGPVAAPASSSTAPVPAGTKASPTSPSSSPSASETPTSGTSPADGTREVTHGPRSVAAVALTFHGAGDPRFADAILAAAAKAGAALTVLAVGSWLQTYPQMGDRVLAGGHELGNHTLHHRPMRLMSESAAYAEIVGGQREVHRFTPAPTWFRPSGTPHATPHILAAAARAGYSTSLSFDVDPRDYTDPGQDLVVSRVLGAVRPGSIVSLHLGHAGTVAAMPRLLNGLRDRGLAAVTVSQLLQGVRP
jgi:peptidoglycan/xylan/chitin deacetylase (PgdA/CDA1 family)